MSIVTSIPAYIIWGLLECEKWFLLIWGSLVIILSILAIIKKNKKIKEDLVESNKRLEDSEYSKLIDKFFEDDIRESDKKIPYLL